MFGTVVVGIGIAGSVRIRDLLNPLPSSPTEHLKLLGFVSRRSLGEVHDVKQISLQEALNSKEVQAAIISTDNQNHYESVRYCPPTSLASKCLYKFHYLADVKCKILHVEHIELLTMEYKQLKKEVAGKELVKGTLHFTGGPLDEERSGFPAFSGIARLSWLVDLFGDLTVTSAMREEQKEKNYSRMTANFQTANKRPLTWIEERGPGMKRDKKINFCFTSGCLESLPEAPRSAVGPFMQDLVLFAKKLLGSVSKEELEAEKRRILLCLNLAEEIQRHCERPTNIYS
nr:biliverdin reductase A [Pogona vitticeps]